MKNIVVFASGTGSNAENIIKFFQNSDQVHVSHLFCNIATAEVINKAKYLNVDVTIFTKDDFNMKIANQLEQLKPDLIVLAGFLLKIPAEIIAMFPDKIVNIHPALLPKYGGKGMYGMNVHKAILANKDKETGISIHYVNEHYDEGNIIFQQTVDISSCNSAEEIAAKVHRLEQQHFPAIIKQLID